MKAKENNMKIEESLLSTKCPKCGNPIVIRKKWYSGGCNDYGSFVLECDKCGEQFEIRVGRDVDASSVESGAKVIDKKYE